MLIATAGCAVCIQLWVAALPPTRHEWGQELPPDGKPFLDEGYAYEHFYGKSRREAVELFADNSLYYYEDLMWMPSGCMHFYIESYIDYLISSDSECDSSGASCFYTVVESRAKDIPEGGKALLTRVKSTMEHLERHQEWYCASEEIFGSFADRTAECKKLLNDG